MIGIYTRNKNTAQQFIKMFKTHKIELYQPDHFYDLILWLDTSKPPKEIQSQNIILKSDIKHPLSPSEWTNLILSHQAQNIYENNIFTFDGHRRILFNKKTKKLVSLTEKENDFVVFLIQQPDHSASKESILANVWKYNPSSETHTLESHLYGLKQKLGDDATQFIKNENGHIYLK